MTLNRLGSSTLLLITLLVAAFLRFYRMWDLPPGLWSDEAFYALDALRVLRTGYLAAFFPQNGGREPLFIYLQSVALAIWGVQPWVLHIVPVLAGILTVPLVYLLAKQLFDDEPRSKFVGLTAAAALAVLYWHVTFSRLGFRAILLPAASALAVYFFLRGWRSRHRIDFLWSGIALGLSLYTYLSARLLPFILIGFVATLFAMDWLRHHQGWRPRVSPDIRQAVFGLGLTLVVAAVVAIPLAVDFYLHPDDLFGRSGSVALTPETIAHFGAPPTTTPVQVALQNTVKVAGMFVVSGDMNARHNLPGRPALDPFFAVGLIVALGVGIWRFRIQPAYPLLFIWLIAMSLPSVLSVEAPHFLRTIGAIPPMIVLVADGLTRLWQRIAPRLNPGWLVLLVLSVGGVETFHDYFQVWAKDPEIYTDAFDGTANSVKARVVELSASSDILLPLRLYGSPVINFLLAQDFPRQEALSNNLSLDKPLVLVTAHGAGDKQWVFLHKDTQGIGTVFFPDTIAGAASMRQGPPQPIDDAFGQPVGNAIPLSQNAKALIKPPAPKDALDANFGNQFRLIGYNVDVSQIQPDQTVELALYWQPLVNIDRDYRIFVHILDADSVVRAQWDSQPDFGFYTTGLWQQGTVVVDLYPIHMPADVKPGPFSFEVGWISLGDDRLPLLDAQGKQVDDKLSFGRIVVTEAAKPFGATEARR